MTIDELITAVPRSALTGSGQVGVKKVCDDSRLVEPGDLFVAVRGETVDGYDYVGTAVERGAVAIVSENPMPSSLPKDVTWVLVADSRQALALIASAWNQSPSEDLRVIGVTGTNGKTTTAFLLHHILKATMRRAGLMGTVVTDDGERVESARYTTPGTIELQGLLARMRDNGCPAVAMEVSSQGLQQGRAEAIAFDAAVFTNLTQDHLDYHGSMDRYFAAKRILFDQMASAPGKKTTAVINLDDRYGEVLARDYEGRLKILTIGFGVPCDFRAGRLKQNRQGTEFQLEARGNSYLVRVPLIGRFNVYNVLCALAAAVAIKVPLREAVRALIEAPQVPGRLESVGSVEGASVFVDYAHTPDALDNACRTLRELNPRRLITVFGCGGDRDREKRPLMGKTASAHSDLCIVTSDNPRSESPEQILTDIERGMSGSVYERVLDREEAIANAVAAARGGDVVLIAGKGHENYQEGAEGRMPFDDRKQARQAMDARRKARKEDWDE